MRSRDRDEAIVVALAAAGVPLRVWKAAPERHTLGRVLTIVRMDEGERIADVFTPHVVEAVKAMRKT